MMKFSASYLQTIAGIVLAFLVLVCINLSHHPTAFAAGKTPGTILVLGDSLSGAYGIDRSAGWVSLLQQQIDRQAYDYRVINASVSGDTTRTGLGRIDSALRNHQPAIVIIALGGNDGLRGLAISEIENSLAGIIERCKKNNAKVLLIGLRLPPNYGPEYNRQFSAIYDRLASRYGITLVAKMLDQVAEYRELMQADGMHPLAEAQPRIMRNVWAGLEPMLR